MTALEEQTRVALGGDVVALDGGELDRLLQALVAVDVRAAESVADQIAALRLAGGTIDLTPTEAELVALRLALEALGRGGSPALERLAALCGGGAPAADGAA